MNRVEQSFRASRPVLEPRVEHKEQLLCQLRKRAATSESIFMRRPELTVLVLSISVASVFWTLSIALTPSQTRPFQNEPELRELMSPVRTFSRSQPSLGRLLSQALPRPSAMNLGELSMSITEPQRYGRISGQLPDRW